MITLAENNTIRLASQSWLAYLAAKWLRARGAALVLGKTIHLYGISAEEFRNSPRLIRHEMKHVEQYRRYGMLKFLWLYAWYSLRFGYIKNPLEVEARAAEEDQLSDI